MTRIYADTSIFGGIFDDEFKDGSQKLLDSIKNGKFKLVTSVIVEEEVKYAPPFVKNLYYETIRNAEIIHVNQESLKLMKSCRTSKIFPTKVVKKIKYIPQV